jgi:hypothetical protein
MHINIKDFLKDCGLEERFYPGKRFVKRCVQPGEFKSHAIIYDWSNPDLIRVEVKAGLAGDHSNILPAELIKYPVSLQAETFFEIDASSGEVTKRSSDDEEESGGSKGKGGSKGQKKGKKKLSMLGFSTAVAGAIPEAGELKKAVIMGMEIAKEAFEPVIAAFVAQAEKSKIISSDLLSKAGKYITKFQPPAFLEAKGNEDAPYKYDSEKNQSMFGMNLG